MPEIRMIEVYFCRLNHDRYKAEIRRAVNDEKLTNIAEKVAGPGTENSWIREGRRNVKLLKRKSPRMSLTLQVCIGFKQNFWCFNYILSISIFRKAY